MLPIARLPLAMLLLMLLLLPTTVLSFVPPSVSVRPRIDCARRPTRPLWTARERAGQQQVYLDPTLDDDRVTELFAWICRAFAGDGRYDNLMLAMAAIFGTNLDEESMPKEMAREAMDMLPPPPPPRSARKNVDDETEDAYVEVGGDYPLMGRPISLHDREMASMGAMGAAQWTGRFRTRPHALLDVRNMTSVDDWVRTLPRGVRRTLKRAQSAACSNFTVVARPILGDEPAPHSSLPHFRCVVEHEVRVITRMYEEYGYGSVFFDALSEAVGRYVGTTRMTGEIREYRSSTDGRVIAFAHEVRKGRVIRGQWFYATDEASRNYVWFHSVHDLVRRAIETDGVDVVDLGPSGSDAFSELKERYGFVFVEDWPAVADYSGPFWDHGAGTPSTGGEDGLSALLRAIAGRRSAS